ncbi:hypothetical protein JQ594_27985 [Bradyrhizobium manausense]|uniref:hypothetical protein n=1 Tax=Bradyrhizobium manausense TaxID=989370 RepID=UPI001BADF748|nr:hypothetical protein [Bradyrhizobium manausense]MBR0689785.1 hypothetical protein [Bradyrhizobium manausense]
MAGRSRPKDGVALAYDPAIRDVLGRPNNVDARAFASPKRLRPRRRDKPGRDVVETEDFES